MMIGADTVTLIELLLVPHYHIVSSTHKNLSVASSFCIYSAILAKEKLLVQGKRFWTKWNGQ